MGRTMLMDALLRIRRDMEAGRIAMHLGEIHVDVMDGFIAGYLASLNDQGLEDAEYSEFREWLWTRGEFPPEGWGAKYLRDCRGDHHEAIRKLLDFVAEFTTMKRPVSTEEKS